jgi:uncharacterized protein YndB with AHSA1/START domain
MEAVDLRSDSRSRIIPATPDEVFAAIADPDRIARWWGPSDFTNTIHDFEFVPGGRWLLTMHGPDGQAYPNESRFSRIEPGRVVQIEHLSGHHFFLTLELSAVAGGTRVHWCQTFDTVEHYRQIAQFVAQANAQNLERLAQEVGRLEGAASGDSALP